MVKKDQKNRVHDNGSKAARIALFKPETVTSMQDQSVNISFTMALKNLNCP